MPAAPPTDWDDFPQYWATLLATQATQAPAAPWPLPQQIHILSQVVSTNETLWQYLAQGHPVGTTVIAQHQTAGRGQWGRHWTSATGGLYLSWSCAPHLRAEWAAQLTLCSAWGIATALRQWAIPVAIKWPNDLVLQGRKLGGILTETRLRGDIIHQAVVGVGINWANPVPPVGINVQTFWAEPATGATVSQTVPPGEATDRAAHPAVESAQSTATLTAASEPGWEKRPATLAHLAAIVLHGMVTGYAYWQHEGIAKLLPAYESLLSQHYRTVEVNGQFLTIVGITPEGALRVQGTTATGRKAEAEQIFRPGQIRLGYDVNES